MADEVFEFFQPVLHRRSGHQQDPVGTHEPLTHGLCSLGVGVLDVVRLVDDHNGWSGARPIDGADRSEGGQGNAAAGLPAI